MTAARRHLIRSGNSSRVRWAGHTYTVLTEILDPDGEACRTRYLYRITEGDTVISEEQITGCSNHPAGNVLRQELIAAGFTQAEGADGLLTWHLT